MLVSYYISLELATEPMIYLAMLLTSVVLCLVHRPRVLVPTDLKEGQLACNWYIACAIGLCH